MFKRILSVLALLMLVPFLCVFTFEAGAGILLLWIVTSGMAKLWTAVSGKGHTLLSAYSLGAWLFCIAMFLLDAASHTTAPQPTLTVNIVGYAVLLGWPLVDCLNILLPDPDKK